MDDDDIPDFQRYHRTAVFLEMDANPPAEFWERVLRFISSLNTPATIKADVFQAYDGKITLWDGAPKGEVAGGFDCGTYAVCQGYVQAIVLSQPKVDMAKLQEDIQALLE